MKETYKPEDFTKSAKEISELMKESYLNGVEAFLSIWHEKLKFVDTHIDHWFTVYHDSIKAGIGAYEKLPNEFSKEKNAKVLDAFDRIVAFQKDYIESMKKVSDKFAKEVSGLAQKNVEKAFSMSEDYINNFKI